MNDLNELFIILKDIILPIFVIISVGYLMQRKFNLNVQTLARLNIYYLVPGFIFVKLYTTKLTFSIFYSVILFFILYVLVLYLVSLISSKILGLKTGEKTAFTNSVLFYNSGNYGVPVNDLVFKSDPFAMSIQVLILTFQNIFLFSYGIFTLQSVKIGKIKAILAYFKMPVLYAMLLGISLNIFHVPIPNFIWIPANYTADAMVALALVTLGAQVATIEFKTGLSTVYASLFLRLILGPVLALGLILLFRIDGTMAQALLIGAAMPTSVNSAVIAQEYDNHPELAAQIVLFSTAMSAITVSIVIFLSKVLF